VTERNQAEGIDDLLERVRRGEAGASDELAALAYDELHGLARRFMDDQRQGHTLQPTALVHEAWVRLAAGRVPEGRAHFLRVAAASMRSILVDHARRHSARKRGEAPLRHALDDLPEVGTQDDGATLLALHDVLESLARGNPEAAQVAEMRLFGGMEHAEVAVALGLSTRSVDRLWQAARAALQNQVYRRTAR